MAFPSPSLSPPALSLYQLSYRGLAFGGIDNTQPYQIIKLDGIGNPESASGDAQRPLDQGEFAGFDVTKGRDVTLEQGVRADGVSLDHARQALEDVMTVTGNTEYPLYLRLPSGVFACMARPRRHNPPPIDLMTVQAGGGVALSQWHATDPRWYAAPTKQAVVGLPENQSGLSLGGPGSGISFGGAGSGISFGGGYVGGLVNVLNAGRYEMRPVLVFAGPCINPIATNLSLPGAPSIGVEVTLGVGDLLTIDTDIRSVLLQTAGTSGGASRREQIMAGSTWWSIEGITESNPTGLNLIEFTTADPAKVSGTLTIQSADAYMGL